LSGGFLLLPNPIFRSGEDCRHSNLNNPQDIARQVPRSRHGSDCTASWFATRDTWFIRATAASAHAEDAARRSSESQQGWRVAS
jgi:hypothetical protein